MKADFVNSLAFTNIQRLATARENLAMSLVRNHWSPELRKRYMELDIAFVNAIKAESERLGSVQEEEHPCKQN